MINIEVRGIPCVFNDDAMDDFDMLEYMERMTNGDVIALVPFAKGVFGEEQMANIKDSLRGESGVCKLSDMSAFVNECVQEAANVKRASAKN